MSTEQFYAYRVTDVTGTQVGKTEPGQHLLEREYKGNGTYTWVIYDFGKEHAPVSATITGTYVGKVEGVDGKLTDESRRKLTSSESGLAERGSAEASPGNLTGITGASPDSDAPPGSHARLTRGTE